MIASQIAEMVRGYEARGVPRDRQTLILLATVVKLTVENFVLHQRLLRGARGASALVAAPVSGPRARRRSGGRCSSCGRCRPPPPASG